LNKKNKIWITIFRGADRDFSDFSQIQMGSTVVENMWKPKLDFKSKRLKIRNILKRKKSVIS